MIKQLIHMFNYKIIYQLLYVLFNLLILKQLSVEEYGEYSYLLALIIYFSALIQLGLPIYIQKNIAQGNSLDRQYFNISIGIFILVTFINFILQDNILYMILTEIIILSMVLVSIGTSMQNGKEDYVFQYRVVVISSVWMLFIVFGSYFFKITILSILLLWSINAIITIFYMIYFLKNSNVSLFEKDSFTIDRLLTKGSLLVTLFFVSIPYETFRVMDKIIIKERFDETLLGYYSFNLFAIMMVFSFSIRPLSSIMLTKIAQSKYDFLRVKYTVFFMLINIMIFSIFYILYSIFAGFFLDLFGLEKYITSIEYFIYIWLYMLFYSLSIPFVMIINVELNNRKRLLYMVSSLVILIGIPVSALYSSMSFIELLILICISFFLHLILVIFLTRKYFDGLVKIWNTYINTYIKSGFQLTRQEK